MTRTPPLSLDTVAYRLVGDPGADVCCYADCDAKATCWVYGKQGTWSVVTTPREVTGKDRPQAHEFCEEHGHVVAERRMARVTPPYTAGEKTSNLARKTPASRLAAGALAHPNNVSLIQDEQAQ